MVPRVHAIIDQTEAAALALIQSGGFGDEVTVVKDDKMSVFPIKTLSMSWGKK